LLWWWCVVVLVWWWLMVVGGGLKTRECLGTCCRMSGVCLCTTAKLLPNGQCFLCQNLQKGMEPWRQSIPMLGVVGHSWAYFVPGHCCVLGRHWALLGAVGHSWVLLGSVGCCWMLLDYCWAMLGEIWVSYRALLGVILDTVGRYWVPLNAVGC